MSCTPCEDSSSPFKVVSGTSLRISPNLEALLQHDELCRRTCGSPTSLYHPISGFAVSLPPPPPRNNSKKATSPETRVNLKEIRRKASVNVRSDSWPDALPACSTPVGRSSPAPSRCATPNPFINPTPTINTSSDPALPLTHPSLTESHLPPPRRSEPDVRRAPPIIIPPTLPSSSHRSSPTLYKVEKMFSKGRESLSILTGAAIPSGLKLKHDDHIDRRPHRTELVEFSANQSSLPMPQIRQDGGLGNRSSMSHQSSALGGTELVTVSNVSPIIPTQQQWPSATSRSSLSIRPDSAVISPSASSTRSLPLESSTLSSAVTCSEPLSAYYASSLPHLPPISPIEMPSLHEQTNDGSQSFIDFFSPPSPFFQDTQDNISTLSARRPSAPAILSSGINSTASYNNSSLDDLPSMVFAPPSPTSLPNERPSSPACSRPSSSLSSYSDVSAMIFAPGSPTSDFPLSPISPRPSSSIPSTAIPDLAPTSPAYPDTLKPPVPTTAKPLFEKRNRGVRLPKRSVSSSPQPLHTRLKVPLPPTTNTLQASERADLIRRNRKLVQLLGQAPSTQVDTSVVEEPRLFKMLPQPAFSALLGSVKQKHKHRHAMSVSVALNTPSLRTEPSPPWQVLDCLPSSSGRRHSTPYTPRNFTLYFDNSLDSRDTHDHHGSHRHWNLSSPTSFIDLSDEDIPHDPTDVVSIETENGLRNHSSSTPSLMEGFSPEGRAEAEKRRKRDKLAKLHRFLGSRVPADLVVGHIAGPSLPPASTPEDCRNMWLCKRTSGASSFERVKDELDVEEKALNVRRAQKMEKLFGTPPPQTLYHTRHIPTTVARSQPTSPVSSVMIPHYLSDDSIGVPRRNPNQTAYMKGKRTHRPGTSESTTHLLPIKPSTSPESSASYLDAFARSSVYLNYQHSIASLTDIIERDDRESLAELHRFLHGEMVESPTDEQPLLAAHRLSTSTYSSYKSERRHSLPTRTSMTSISTELLPPPKPELSNFQLRRRRAAKLTNFFGVDYHELIHDILESIEKGVEEERKRGTLRPEEVESLLHKLHDLRMRRDGFL